MKMWIRIQKSSDYTPNGGIVKVWWNLDKLNFTALLYDELFTTLRQWAEVVKTEHIRLFSSM